MIGADIDAFYCVPFILFAVHIMRKFPLLGRVFEALGKNSTNMWLIHSLFIYCFGFFQPIIYYTGCVEIIYPCFVLFIFIAALSVTMFYKQIEKVFSISRRN